MPWIEYPIEFKNKYLSPDNEYIKLNAQTLKLSEALPAYSYQFSEGGTNRSHILPLKSDLPEHLQDDWQEYVPLAPIQARKGDWGIPSAAKKSLLLNYFRPQTDIGLWRGGAIQFPDIALAGTRPVNDYSVKMSWSPSSFKRDLTEAGWTYYDKISAEIWVYRLNGKDPTLFIDEKFFSGGSQVKMNRTAYSIPDVPFFVFNFGAVSSGGPANKAKQFSGDTSLSESTKTYVVPGGGSGAGGLFTAVLGTNPVEVKVAPNYVDEVEHIDKITISYMLAEPSKGLSSSVKSFDGSSIPDTDPGIDLLQVHADLHYKSKANGNFYHYSRNYAFPGGLKYGLEYSTKAKKLIDDFRKYKGYTDSVNGPDGSLQTSEYASALVFQDARWIEPSPVEDMIESIEISLYTYIEDLNPECLFPCTYPCKAILTDLTPKCSGASGRPSILYNGPEFIWNASYNSYFGKEEKGDLGTGGWGMVSLSVINYYANIMDGGNAGFILSW